MAGNSFKNETGVTALLIPFAFENLVTKQQHTWMIVLPAWEFGGILTKYLSRSNFGGLSFWSTTLMTTGDFVSYRPSRAMTTNSYVAFSSLSKTCFVHTSPVFGLTVNGMVLRSTAYDNVSTESPLSAWI